ncbi:hypothetical protein H5410_044680 [Solanum commersonii]|uniref:Uncharacterized protein n=1 Tax=Solanum commersonii TaxID=4109 RepID=A0A9J5XAE4_SOLCO|nr:hypothetical protein H5410_044680 [Solanum commersonii]
MAEKETLGHQKILMAKTDDEDDIYSTFPKRCASLNKKASDMIGKYDIDSIMRREVKEKLWNKKRSITTSIVGIDLEI